MTYIFIAITALVSIACFSRPDLAHKLQFNAWQIKHQKQYWRAFSYALVHGGWAHLLVNMLVLFSFGRNIEFTFTQLFGASKGLLFYGLLYVGGIIFSTLFDYIKQQNNIYYNAVGASGAVSAVLFASILLFPKSGLIVFPIPIPIPAFIFGILYLIYSAYMAKKGIDNVGHTAHFSGAVFGFLFPILLKPDLIQHFLAQF